MIGLRCTRARRKVAKAPSRTAASSERGGCVDVEQPAREERAKRSQPLLFISHRHADREIADVVRNFITYRGGGDVDVFQTSSADAQAPKIGRNINRELMKALWKSEVLILIYTSQERDWDYCMWECGVATHRESDDTHVIVLQCGRQLPRVFADQVAVDIRDPEKVRRFVNDFLTDPDFFPGRNEAVTRFQPNDANVERMARGLYDELQNIVRPDDDHDQIEEWPAVPFVRLGLTSSQVRQIAEEDDDDHAWQTTARLLLEAACWAPTARPRRCSAGRRCPPTSRSARSSRARCARGSSPTG